MFNHCTHQRGKFLNSSKRVMNNKTDFLLRYVGPEDWDTYLRNNVPELQKLWEKGNYDAYETWKTLRNLTYQDYLDNRAMHVHVYCPYIPITYTRVSNEYTDA